jgi:hypothetical protein
MKALPITIIKPVMTLEIQPNNQKNKKQRSRSSEYFQSENIFFREHG